MIASDGVQTLSEAEIGAVVAQAGSAREVAVRLVGAVEARGRPRQDNTTVQVIRIEDDLPAGRGGAVGAAVAGVTGAGAAPGGRVGWWLPATVGLAALVLAVFALVAVRMFGLEAIERAVGVAPARHHRSPWPRFGPVRGDGGGALSQLAALRR